MSIAEFITRIRNEGVQLSFEDNRLKVALPKGINPAIKSELIAKKDDIKQYFLLSLGCEKNSQIKISSLDYDFRPLSLAQKRLWFLDRFEKLSSHYNMPLALGIEGNFNLDFANQALICILDRHQVLRSVYVEKDQEVGQQLAEQFCFAITQVDLSELVSEDKERELTRLRNEDALKPFDLAYDLMLRATWVLLSSEAGEVKGTLLFNMHHIASDAWSMDILFNEFNFYYYQVANGQNVELPSLEIQYSDYAIWQSKRLATQYLEAQQDYWQEQLTDLPLIHSLSTDFPRTKEQDTSGATLTIPLNAQLFQAIKKLAQQHNTTAFIIFHSAFSVLLSRYSNETDIVIGTPVANRNNPQLASLIGFFINTLVLRTDVDESLSLQEYIVHVKEVNLAAQQHQDMPFDQIVEMLNPERATSYNPLFQIMLNMYQSTSETNTAPTDNSSDIRITAESQNQTNAICDLVLNIYERELGADLVFEYNSSLFSAKTIKAMGEQLRVLLQQMTLKSDVAVSELSMLDAQEYQRLIRQFDNLEPQTESITLHGLFEQQSRTSPDKIAAIHNEQSWSYRQLNSRANQIADWLLNNGISHQTAVGLVFNRSLEWLAAMLGVMKAGAMYVPLDPGLPQGRIEHILKLAEVALVLGHSSLLHDTIKGEYQKQAISSDFFVDIETQNPNLAIKGHEPAYVYFTSGSTGKPKGAVNSHQGAASMMLATSEKLGLTKHDRFMQFAAVGFDVVVEELFPIWFSGGTVVLRQDNEILSTSEFQSFIQTYGITSVELTVPFWHTWVEVLCDNNLKPPVSLKFVIVGGDKISLDIYQRWLQFDIPLFNAYGLTETGCTNLLFNAEGPLEYPCFPIGKPLENVSLFILNKHMQPLPNGVPGELYIGGPGVGIGYINQPELTQERFIEHSFAQQAPRRLYKTGDLIRVLSDGNIEFLGRFDEQVKLRGFRIELAEIEAYINLMDEIGASVVVLHGEEQNKQLVAYYVLAASMKKNSEEKVQLSAQLLSQRLLQNLPAYMVPGHFLQLEEWPLTANGKINKRALPEPQFGATNNDLVVPASKTESILLQIWAKVLSRDSDSICTTADFFTLGGQSLLAVRLVSEIRKQLNVEVSIKNLFNNASIAKLGLHIDSLSHSHVRPNISKRPKSDKAPLSFSQQRLWFINQLQGKQSTNYNLPMAVKFAGCFSIEVAEQALNQIVQRHEILRTVYVSEGAEVYQVILDQVEFTINREDLSDINQEQQLQAISESIANDVSLAFDLERDIPIRARWLQLAQHEGILLFNMHHIASDGWSMNILILEFCSLYQAYMTGDAPALAPLELQYADYAHWQRDYLQGEIMQTQLNYWLKQLADAPVLHSLPLDYPRSETSGQQGQVYSSKLPTQLADGVKTIAIELGMTPFMVLHAVLSLVLSKHSGSSDIVIGSPVANRLQAELEPMIGFFVNTLVLRVDTSGHEYFVDYLKYIKQVHLDALSHQDIPFEQLVQHLRLPRDTSYNPLFQVMFTLDENDQEQFAVGGINISELEEGAPPVKCDLDISVQFGNDGLYISWLYDTSLFSEQTVARLNDHLVRLFAGYMQTPTTASMAMNMLSDAELQQLDRIGNHSAPINASRQLLHHGFERLMPEYGHEPAVRMGEEGLSYSGLNRQANNLAHLLLQQGVKEQSRVGIYLNRGVNMVVAMLAVLKTGAAYVPMDREYPSYRLAFMAQDTQMQILLTEQALANKVHWPVGMRQLSLDDTNVGRQFTGMPDEDPRLSISPDATAYIIYTSGSTGQPKGVLVAHKDISDHIATTIEEYQFSAADKILQLTSFAFDTFLEQSYAALCSGAELVITERLLSPDNFFSIVAKQKISITDLPPAYFSECLAPTWHSNWQASKLRLVVIGGESVSTQTLKKWLALKLDCCQLVNAYGPTEGVITAAKQVLGQQDLPQIRIGKVFGNRRLFVLDDYQQLVPKGSTGELYIGGPLIAKGYLDREQDNKYRFIANPLNPQETLYRTGDLVAYDKDGAMHYCGRADEQIKIRGYRIEPGEISVRISAIEGINESYVTTWSNSGQIILVAYYQTQTDTANEFLNPDELRKKLMIELPKYMVPDSLIMVTKWPLNHNGKIDKRKLPEPKFLVGAAELVLPETQEEQVLQNIWSKILNKGSEQIGVEHNFFSLGGHSLLVIRMLSEIRERLAVELPVKVIFELPTIKQLADFISENAVATELEQITTITRDQEYYPISFAQQRLWFIDKLGNGSAEYNMPMAFKISGDFDVTLAELALNRIVQRHESLRTNFVDTEQGPKQILRKDPVFAIRRINESQKTLTESEIKQLIVADAAQSFDLAFDWLLQVSIAKIDGTCQLLLINMHHIISDGWSMTNLTEEFIVQYTAARKGDADPMVPLPLQYIDYAHWQRLWLSQSRLQPQLSYWQEQLFSLPVTHALPLDFHRPEIKNYAGDLVSFALNAKQSLALQQLAISHNVTAFMTLHAVIVLLISKLSNHQDVVLGTPLANRQHTSLGQMIGFFVNTLVLRADANQQTFTDLLAHIRQVNLDAQTHQDVPFDYLVEHCRVPRNASYTPLFQIMFSMDTNDSSDLKFSGAELELLTGTDEPAKFDIEINAQKAGEEIVLSWIYDKSLFSRDTIENMAATFQHIVDQVLTQSDIELQQVVCLTSAQQQKILAFSIGEQTPLEYDNIPQLFENIATKNSAKPVLLNEKLILSYAELNQQANRLCRYLEELGVKQGDKVGLADLRSTSSIIALLAILKSGAVYVPLDLALPNNRLQHIVADAELKLVLFGTEQYESVVALAQCERLFLDDKKKYEAIAKCSSDNFVSQQLIQPDDAAYLLYTSGTTGTPKGVLQTHKTLINLVASTVKEGLKDCLTTLQFTPLTFDVSIQELVTAWYTASPLLLMTRKQKYELQSLPDLISNQSVERVFMAPAVLQVLSEFWLRQKQDFSVLKEIIVAGEALILSQDIRDFFAANDHISLWNHYGPTESHVITTKLVDVAQSDITASIGQVVQNSAAVILNDYLQIVPLGTTGELYLAGEGLALGYLNLPEREQQRFINNPVAQLPFERIYKTGDQAKLKPCGDFEYVARNDNQIQLRGYRVELEEIEVQMLAVPKVKLAVVKPVVTNGKITQLLGYITSDSVDKQTVIDAVWVNLKANLPVYMLPENIALLQTMPLTANGKIDRQALPEIEEPFSQTITKAISQTDKTLVSIWSELLNIETEKLSTTVDFFSLGGHSLLAVRLVAKVRQLLSVEISLRSVFDLRTIVFLAGYIESLPKTISLPPIVAARDKQKTPLSFAQQRLWFIDQLQGGQSANYNLPIVLKLQGEFSLKKAQLALGKIINRHEILRTCYINDGKEVYQQITPIESTKFEISITSLPPSDAFQEEHYVKSYIAQKAGEIFNLSKDLPIKAWWLSMGPDSGVFIISIHHIAFDGWSTALLTDEFSQIYKAELNNETVTLPQLPVQYADYARWQRDYLQGQVLKQHQVFWTQQLAGIAPVHSLVLDFPRGKDAGINGRIYTGSITSETATKVTALAHALKMTPFMVLHGALSLLLARHCNTQDIVIGTPVANRMQTEVESLLGLFVNTLVLRTNSSGYDSFSDYLTHVRQVNLDAQSHQDMPFEQLVELLSLPRNTSHNPVFQIMFTLDNDQSASLELDGLNISTFDEESALVKCDLDISATLSQEGIQVSWLYDVALFSEQYIAGLHGHFTTLLTQLTDAPEAPVAKADMLSTGERYYLLAQAGKGRTFEINELLAHQQFESQVQSNADAIALRTGQQEFSYQQLNQQANRQARYLRGLGLAREGLVGIILPRSFAMVSWVLSILKAGGAYVPLDQDYPYSRISMIVEDTQMQYLITTSELASKFNWPESMTLIKVDCDNDQQAIVSEVGDNLDPVTLLNDLAYVIYTSGSTGKPKGVMLEHNNLCHYLNHVSNEYSSPAYERAILSTSLAFDATITSLFGPLVSGKTLELVEEGQQGIQQLHKLLRSNIPGLFKLTPAHLNLLQQVDYGRPVTWVNKAPHTLVIGGEQLQQSTVAFWREKLPEARFINEYGPTEATVGCAIYDIKHGENECRSLAVVPIGRAIDNIHLYILDEYLQPTPKGVAGELYVSGAGIARGYLNRTELTRERFVSNPHYQGNEQERGYQKLYKTGDVVRFLPDGELMFMNRIDDQVKVRGYRIELDEINHHLRQLEFVEGSYSLVKTLEKGDQRLVSFVTLTGVNDTERLATVKGHLLQCLPSYMLPDAIFELDEWPLTSNGKIDAKALLGLADNTIMNSVIAAETKMEKQLLRIWSDVLQIPEERLGCDSDFFMLGGSSISLIRLLNAINSTFSAGLTIPQLIQNSTIKQSAQLLTGNIEDRSNKSFTCVHQGNQDQVSQNLDSVTLLFPAAGMTSAIYRSVGKVASDQPVYIAEPWSNDPEFRGYTSLEDWVSSAIQWLNQYNVNVNVNILGHSFGGYPAFLLATRLQKMQMKVSLTLIESMIFSTDTNEISAHNNLQGTTDNSDLQGIFQQQLNWMGSYQAETQYTGDINYIFGAETAYFKDKELDRINEVQLNCLKTISVYTCAGDHFSMFSEPYIADLWKCIAK